MDAVLQRLAAQQQAAVCIRDGQWIAAQPVAGAEPALEIGAPRVIRLTHHPERLCACWRMRAWRPSPHGQPGTCENRAAGAGDRPLLTDRRGFVSQWLELLGTPARMRRLGA